MIQLKLSNTTQVCLIDEEDLNLVLSHNTKWHLADSGVYCRSALILDGRGRRIKIAMHRLLTNMLAINDLRDVDHINGNRLDNRRSNLRVCPHQLNLHNTGKRTDKIFTSNYKGVSWHRKAGKWQVGLCVRGRRINGGLFTEEVSAAKMSNKLMLEHLGEYARLNEV